MRCLMAFFVVFALAVTGTSAEAQAPPSYPWSPVVEWIENLMEPGVSGEPSEQKVRDYYHQYLSSKSQRQVTEDQFVNYWRYTGTQAQGGQLPQLSYSIVSVVYNDARDQAHVTYRYRLFAAESPRSSSNDVVLENGVWKMVLWTEIIADMHNAPATQSRPSPVPSNTVPQPTAAAPAAAPSRAKIIFEVTDVPVTSTLTICTPSCGISHGSSTDYVVHLRYEPSSLGIDVRYLSENPQYGNFFSAYLTYRWEGPQGILRLAAGYEDQNEAGYWGTTCCFTNYYYSFAQSGPMMGAEGVWFVNPGLSLEAGGFYFPSMSGTFSISTSPGGGTFLNLTSSATGTGWVGYAGFRYTIPRSGFTITGGYNFLNFNLSQPLTGGGGGGTTSGGTLTENASGPYLSQYRSSLRMREATPACSRRGHLLPDQAL